MAKLTLTDASGGFNSTAQLNANNTLLETEFQDKVLYRNNPTGEPNQMENNLDMNSNRILNLSSAITGAEPVRLQDVTDGFTFSTAATEVTSSFTLSSTYSGNFIETTGSNNIVITIPTESSDNLGNGYIVSGFHHGTGTLTFGVTGITLRINADLSNGVPQYGAWTLQKSITATDTWMLYGYLSQS